LTWYLTGLEVAVGLPPGPRAARLAAGTRVAEAAVAAAAGPGYAPQTVTGLAPIAYAGALATGDSVLAAAARRWTAAGGSAAPLVEFDALAALQAGDTARAAALARQFPLPQPPTTLGLAGLRAVARAEVFARLGDEGRALAWYEFVDPRRFSTSSPFEVGFAAYAPTFLARAALYERRGERAKAAAAYERLLALWRDADPAFAPQLAAARAGLARARDAGAGTAVPMGR
jgi:tetratricopeptide (TPR) repeat protein